MPRFPRITAKQIIVVLERRGFSFSRQSGSHKIYIKQGKRVTVPFHGSTILHPKVLKNILQDAGMMAEELMDML